MKSKKMKAACILFDLDGTLLNTNDLVLESLQHTIRVHLGHEMERSGLYRYFGVPLVKIMADLDPGQAEAMCVTYREYSAERHDKMVKVFPHVSDTLTKLRQYDIPMAVVTSKLNSLALRGLKLFHLDRFFDTLVAFEDTQKHKPEPDPILKALHKLGIPSGDGVVMVGDSPYDIGCAQNAGVLSAAVKWSLHNRGELLDLGPDFWLEDFRELLDYV